MIISSCICKNKSVFKPVIKFSQKENVFKNYRKAIIGQCLNCHVLKTVIKPVFFNPQISHINTYQYQKNKFIRLFLPIVNQIKKIKKTGLVLDVGCSTGIFLNLLKKEGYEVFGIEPNLKAYQLAKKNLQDKILLGTIKTFIKKYPSKKFDIIVYNHVLEHIVNINQEFFYIKKLLNKNGLLVLGVPNIDNIIFKLRKKYWEGLMVNEHVWHFSKNYLINYLIKNGFKILVINFINDKREDYPFLKKIYFYFLNFINKILRTGESIVIYAQKI